MNVAVKSYRYAKGLQDHGVLACAKTLSQYHGDTDVDSHYDLPVINHDFNRLDSPRVVSVSGYWRIWHGNIMVAHLNVPALDARENRPTTLSYNTVTKLLLERYWVLRAHRYRCPGYER